jgi:hypothetical protein
VSTTSSQPTAEVAVSPELPEARRPRRHRRWLLVGVTVAVVAVAGSYIAVARPFGLSGSATSGSIDNGSATSLATVTQRPLSSQTNIGAILGYAGSYSVVNQAPSTVTWLPGVGQVVSQGQVLYRVSNKPVVLLYGTTPSYRDLSEGATASDVTGPDVQELNADLVALGYVTSAELDPTSNQFGYWTKAGVEALQAALGVTQDGTLALGQAVFLPTAARVTTVTATLGGSSQPGGPILTASSTTRVVTVALDAAQQATVKVGDQVIITLPDNLTTAGVVSSVGTVAVTPASAASGGSSTPTIAVGITPSDPAATGTLDQAPVQVAITTASVPSALVVPVNALLSLASGGYAVEAVSASGVHHLVPVALGLFDDADGLVQVSGSGLASGQRVVVPSA